jgi:thiol:disulfide interchange protein DsbD
MLEAVTPSDFWTHFPLRLLRAPGSGRGSARAAGRTSALARLVPFALAAVALLLPAIAHAQEKDAFTRAFEEHGLLLAGPMAFLNGLGACLTPCVFPMIPITVSIFGAKQAKSRAHAIGLSTAFLLGLVVLYTSMLVVAALTGSLFGKALANPFVNAGIGAIFIALSLSMFGAFEMALPSGLMNRLSNVGGIGYGGAFALGLVFSLIAAPCVGPVATSIIVIIGQRGSVGLGAFMGVLFALGLGLPFWLVGAFAVSLPKGGKWMIWVKSVFGIVMLVFALNYIKMAMPALGSLARPGSMFMVAMAAVAVLGVALGAVHLSWEDGGAAVKARKLAGIVLTTAGAFLFLSARDMPSSEATAAQAARPLTWEHSEPAAVTKAQAEKRPMLVDFTAEWCGACKKLSKETFSDPRVAQKAATFVALKVDATNDEDPQVDAVKGKYKVVGLPTVVIYDSKGNERKRFNDFVPADTMLAALQGID